MMASKEEASETCTKLTVRGEPDGASAGEVVKFENTDNTLKLLHEIEESGAKISAAPLVMGFLGNLALATAEATDFALEGTTLPHTESFRASVAYLGNNVYDALLMAHSNMSYIKAESFMLPSVFDDIVELLNEAEEDEIKEELPQMVESIKKTSETCRNKSQAICDTFDKVIDNLNQLNVALSKKLGVVQNVVNDIKGQRSTAEEVRAETESSLQQKQHELRQAKAEKEAAHRDYLNHVDSCHYRGGFWRWWFGYRGRDYEAGKAARYNHLVNKSQMVEHLEAKNRETERQLQDSLQQLQRLRKEGFTQEKALEVLSKVSSHLQRLKAEWVQLTAYFNDVDTTIRTITTKRLEGFAIATEKVSEKSTKWTRKKFQKALGEADSVVRVTHHLATCYVSVSSNHLMPLMNKYNDILALTSQSGSELTRQSQDLNQLVQEAKEGIQEIVQKNQMEFYENTKQREEQRALQYEEAGK